MYAAITTGNVEALSLLLGAGAKPNADAPPGLLPHAFGWDKRPLIMASAAGSAAVVRALVEQGVDILKEQKEAAVCTAVEFGQVRC